MNIARLRSSSLILGFFCALLPVGAAETNSDLSIKGGLEDARLLIEARLKGFSGESAPVIFATSLRHTIHATVEKLSHSVRARIDVLQGDPKEIALILSGEGDIRQVTGDGLQDWSVRQQPGGNRFLVIRPAKGATNLVVTISAETELKSLPGTIKPLAVASAQPALSQGVLILENDPGVSLTAAERTGLAGIDPQFVPDGTRNAQALDPDATAFRFDGAYTLSVSVTTADPELRQVILLNGTLTGTLDDESATFLFTATARVRNPKGGSITLLSGSVGLSELPTRNETSGQGTNGTRWRIKFDQDRFVAVFDGPGDYPISVRFNASVRHADMWNSLDFQVAPSALQPLTISGLPADTQFRVGSGARPERNGNNFTTFLPPDGAVRLSWKATRAESEGKLFFSAEMLSQISVSPGLMRQLALLDGKVMQGELTKLSLRLVGEGEVTRVQGEQVLSWNLEPIADSKDRRLIIQFNQALKDTFSLQLQMQTPLAAFPQSFDAMRLLPEGATRFAGYIRVINEGAVRLEVATATGLSQVSPEQFPQTDRTKTLFPADAKQRFVYRFSGAAYGLRIQADNVLPEISVSQVAAYNLAETELTIDAELELDIREAPVRELLLSVPKGYALARLVAAGMSDYFVKDTEAEAQLRIVYGQPITGRQMVQLRLERNRPAGETTWVLPRIDVPKVKSMRGHIAVSSDPGYRLNTASSAGLTDIATAFFPRKVTGIQVAFRISESAWAATMRIERLPQSIQVDAFHLFSIGERIAYGSSVLNYLISGAPVSTLHIDLSSEYYNVEFLGKDVRAAQKTDRGYEVQLHTPVAGGYTILVTYERPFKGQGETLTFTGARPLDAQSEQGHTLVVSAYQFKVNPVNVSSSLLPLDPAEVPTEYRLFFDAPILAAYRYTARPFNLQLVLNPLAQGDTLSQVADRASMTTRISKQGQVVTDARYFIKNRGQPHFRLTLPPATALWSVMVNGVTAVPTLDGNVHLIPLPQHADPNAVTTVDLKLASRSANAGRVQVAAPVVGAPVLLAEWKVEPDAGQRLQYHHGTLAPAEGLPDDSGFARLAAILGERESKTLLALSIALLIAGVMVWNWSSRPGVYKFSARHISGTVVGLAGVGIGICALAILLSKASGPGPEMARGLTFVAPIQQAGNAMTIEVDNVSAEFSIWSAAARAWPLGIALLALVFALKAASRPMKSFAFLVAWICIFWAALRSPGGAMLFFAALILFVLLHVVIPAARRLWRAPVRPRQSPPPSTAPAAAAAAVAIALLCSLANLSAASSTNMTWRRDLSPPIADSVRQQIHIDEQFAFAKATIRWNAVKGQVLPLLHEPGVLTRIDYPTNSLKLIRTASGTARYEMAALATGVFEITIEYQVQPTRKDGEAGFALPSEKGLVNEVTLTLANGDLDVNAPSAVFIDRQTPAGSTNTVARVVLRPVTDAWIGWKPRSRDTRREKAVFYAEIWQLYVPSAGVIEGQHQVQIRPAHGELSELTLNVPAGATITDVTESGSTNGPAAGLVSVWRFDPDSRQLRVALKPAQSKPFSLVVRSQIAVGPLPVEQRIGLLSITNAAGQIGLVGVATGPEVQLDAVNAESLTPINLEDFPPILAQRFASQFSGITVRRAFRYSDPANTLTLAASAVEPDVRVETQQTLSLGEDRTLLAANLSVEITRAGIFRLSFILPAGLDIESISGPALSHWTEMKSGDQRVITMHLTGKTEGQQQFSINLSGPGTRASLAWPVPRLLVREAAKQRGQLVVVPEQGLRLQVAAREGVTQLDPQKAGIKQKGVLAFRLLHDQWSLTLDMEQVDPWVQVSSLQHVVIGEAEIKVTANLQYQIENTGLKALRVFLPTNAESVQFRGEQVADFLPVPGSITNGLQEWEVKLHRRVIAGYPLQVSYQSMTPAQQRDLVVRGVEVSGVNLQRGFVTVEGAGRLQIQTGALPGALQPSDWQTVPRQLRQDLQAAAANYTFRLIEPSFRLPITVERHEAAKLLPAHVNHITLRSVVSDDGVMLTHARLDMVPGDKRLLRLTLPRSATFWFAFVNQSGVAPWLDKDQILIPLEQQSKPDVAIAVEIFYSSDARNKNSRSLDLELLGPKFDLPLEDITWKVFLNEKWKVTDWSGTLQLTEKEVSADSSSLNLNSYLQQEAAYRVEKTKEAEQQLQLGNTLLARGDQQQARQAFNNAYGLSQHDMAFNEDARVQLHNVKMQQALVGLSVRQSAVAGQAGALVAKLRELRNRGNAAYTQDEAKQLLDRNPADENSALMRLAEKMIQQQDAAVAAPAAIRAAIPEHGRVLTFKRAVQVDTWSDLRVGLQAKVTRTASYFSRFLWLLALAAMVGLVFAVNRRRTLLS